MMGYLKSEWLKYHRTLLQKLMVITPLFFVLQAVPQKLFMPADYFRNWDLVMALVYNWWTVILLPLGIALFAVLVADQEKKAGHYKSLLSLNVSPRNIWYAKIAVLAGYLLLSTIVLNIAIILAGLITAKGAIPLKEICFAGLVIWLTSLSFIPIQLFLASLKGMFLSLSVGFMGLILGTVYAPKNLWYLIPWAWPARMIAPIIGVHPNGVLLASTDPLRDTSVILPGLIISLSLFSLLSYLTAVWFQKKEVLS